MISHFTKNSAKSRFTATMKLTIDKEEISLFTFHQEKSANHESRKYHPLPPCPQTKQYEKYNKTACIFNSDNLD